MPKKRRTDIQRKKQWSTTRALIHQLSSWFQLMTEPECHAIQKSQQFYAKLHLNSLIKIHLKWILKLRHWQKYRNDFLSIFFFGFSVWHAVIVRFDSHLNFSIWLQHQFCTFMVLPCCTSVAGANVAKFQCVVACFFCFLCDGVGRWKHQTRLLKRNDKDYGRVE